MPSRQVFQPPRVLVVDDHPDSLELLSTILSMRKYEVEISEDGVSAIQAARAKPPDVVLLDVNMSNMNGFEVCQQLRSNSSTADIPIIFVSGSSETRDKIKAFKEGGNDYITKPIQPDEVIARIENQVQIGRLKAELQAKNARLEQQLIEREKMEKKLLDLNEQLSKLAALDSLTQIANRRRFEEFFAREWQRGQRDKQPLSLIICDIDYFKLYNDSLGHQSGDACLQKVARTILNTVMRPADLVARYGGEEFAVILPQTPAQNALQVAQTIRQKVSKLAIPHPKSQVSDYVSLSLGVSSVIPEPKYTRKQLLVTADKALYQAKKQGRDRAILTNIDPSLSNSSWMSE